MEYKRLRWNTISSLIYQIIAIISGFIIPRLILQSYGSEVNGLINSISQFLSFIVFLEMGVGAVVQQALYRPVVEKNYKETSEIVTSADRFFRRLGFITILYILCLMILYPNIVKDEFGYIFTATLIFAMSINTVSQYFFGIVNSNLISADQHGYIQYNLHTVTLVLNTIVSIILIYMGASIHFVKLSTSLIYLMRPLLLHLYVKKNYQLNRNISYEKEPLTQKWNGVAQHIASIVLDSTDIIVLTIFTNLNNVSVYSVYYIVLSGVKRLFFSLTDGIAAFIGMLWAKQDEVELRKYFSWMEWSMHNIAIFIFGCTMTLIIPFVKVYTHGIEGVDYIVPVFSFIITLATGVHCLYIPYITMILASGHFKSTQNYFFIAAFINIVVSIVGAINWGLVGVATGTLIAFSYHTIWMTIYNTKHLIKGTGKRTIRQFIIDALIFTAGLFISSFITLGEEGYLSWIIMAVKAAIVWMIIIILFNVIFYRDYALLIKDQLLNKGGQTLRKAAKGGRNEERKE